MTIGRPVTTIRSDQVRYLVIECRVTCDCPEHEGKEWRTSKQLHPDTSIDYARVLMERHAQVFHKSGPYRLVEYVETATKTQEVL